MQAEALFREGREALARGDTAVACEKLSRSNELDPALGTQLNLGECEAERGRVATAYQLFRAVEQQLDPQDIRAPIAKSKREAAEMRLPKLAITLPSNAPPDTRVYIGDRVFTAAELRGPLIVDPGILELTVTAPGYGSRTLQVLMEESKTTSAVVATLIAPIASVPRPAASASTGPQSQHLAPPAVGGEQRGHDATRRMGGVFLGIGIGSLFLGGVAGLLTLDAKRTNEAHCNQATSSCDSLGREAANRGQVMSALTTTGLAIGAASVGIGTYLLLRRGTASTSVSLQAAGSGSTFIVQQSF